MMTDVNPLSTGPQRAFSGPELDQVAFPLGGIGAGSLCLGGSGQIKDLSLFHKPNIGVKIGPQRWGAFGGNFACHHRKTWRCVQWIVIQLRY